MIDTEAAHLAEIGVALVQNARVQRAPNFAIGDLDGNLSSVDVACDRGTAEFEYSETSEWSLPESWGACKVTVSGRRDSEFVLYEFQ